MIEYDTIRVKNAVFYAYHGVMEDEQNLGGKFECDVEMRCDFAAAVRSDSLAMTVDYEKEGGINTVQASGNVKMSQADRVATGTRIIFYNTEQKIVMTGNPKIWQGANLISCDKITVLLEQDKIFFEGKVDSTIFPKSIQDAQKKDVKQVEAIPSGTKKP